ncbi:MAG TPA: acetaldehyde dehydrogenase (acetylating) [Terriglobia bacterium]|nr:acetaldehyde dehydrogenase (acetylating) [Terriglobia bacterium]HVQ63568.1 acetaldehyde dehydrogenase (acetylating) [Terriglobia bacterium]
MNKDLESIQEARDLAEAAYKAFQAFEHFSEEQVERILAEISKAGVAHAASLAKLAVEETGYGTVEHKTLKNLFCARDVYNAIKPMKTVGIVSEDTEKKIFEVASPIGVIAAIIPSTNPTSTAIYKALIALKGRNTIVFSPHPSATKCILETTRVIAEAAERAGAPQGAISCMKASTIEGAEALMKHARTSLILATGGTGLVKAAYSAGKPAFGVGPGNVPTYIEGTADVPKAVRDILTGKTFDNGTLCSSEQSIVCDESVKDAALEQLRVQGAYICNAAEKVLLEKVIQTPRRTLNTKIVGQSAVKIAEMAGFKVPPGTRAIVAHADGVGAMFPISMEKLSPLLGFYVVKNWQEGCAKCIEILSFGGLGHTLSLHTREDRIVREFGLKKPAFRICVNTPAALGAVGYTTNLFPSMTLGCGAPGNNITSDNISPLHLINLKRVAYGVRDVEAPMPAKRGVIEKVVDQWLERKSEPPSPQPAPPPLSSYKELQPAPAAPVAFVCEEDVRTAIDSKSHIVLGRKTIVTPSARELGEAHDIFVTAD